MDKQIQDLIEGLTYEDLVTIFETAKIALDSIPDDVGNQMDLSEAALNAIGGKLDNAME